MTVNGSWVFASYSKSNVHTRTAIKKDGRQIVVISSEQPSQRKLCEKARQSLVGFTDLTRHTPNFLQGGAW